MTLLSIFCPKLVEAKQHGGVPNAPAVVKPNSVNGGYSWFFDAASKLGKRKESSNVAVGDPEKRTDVTKDVPDADSELNDIVIQNPQISGATLINMMRTKGLKAAKVTEAFRARIADLREAMRESARVSPMEYAAARVLGKSLKIKKTVEADSASAFPQVTRESKDLDFIVKGCKFLESASDDGIGPTKFNAVLIQEGMGNFGDAFYYTREALESAIPIFTGAKIYADHPSSTDEETRPERSVKDIIGHYENLQVTENKGGQAELTGEVHVLPDKPYEWARALMRQTIEHAKKFPDKNLVGLSINASGGAVETPIDEVLKTAPESAKPKLIEAQQNGIDSVKVVSKIKSAVSCDLVTEAGAGGKIINLIEGDRK